MSENSKKSKNMEQIFLELLMFFINKNGMKDTFHLLLDIVNYYEKENPNKEVTLNQLVTDLTYQATLQDMHIDG